MSYFLKFVSGFKFQVYWINTKMLWRNIKNFAFHNYFLTQRTQSFFGEFTKIGVVFTQSKSAKFCVSINLA